jgi:hypothetical protein
MQGEIRQNRVQGEKLSESDRRKQSERAQGRKEQREKTAAGESRGRRNPEGEREQCRNHDHGMLVKESTLAPIWKERGRARRRNPAGKRERTMCKRENHVELEIQKGPRDAGEGVEPEA